ncbi:type VI secretion system baseplate subunit TssG [Pedobacter hartonius]|uniref:Type VI secretion, VasB, ImpH, VC_A0111 n=1 Tax=Pedobacter hartonius TaxID=425514 RepID=A0A1H4H820_9SPHI|nr:type VI secretion system baseplate subunit TssG [Pedobacter hartonius]SEB17781.1 Type VI secretion, VasB, ImpH, VC_A0111 [Pedobacter hartonius]
MKTDLNFLNGFDTDFKAIVKVAELMENEDYHTDQVVVLPIGAKQSAYAKDIIGVSSYYSESKLMDCFIVEVNREGLYDMLPEGLFHYPPVRSSGLSEQQMINDVELKRSEEKVARRFFMPFEAELNHMRTLLAWYENRLDKKTDYNDLSMLFGVEWKEFQFLDREQSIIWMHLLPLIQRKRNDMFFLGQLLAVLFNIPVQAVLNSSAVIATPIEENMQFKMGNGALGIDTIIGVAFDDIEEEMCVHIGPAGAEKLVNFMPGTPYSRLLDIVVSYLVPAETSVKTELITSREHRAGALGAESANSFLGYTVYL